MLSYARWRDGKRGRLFDFSHFEMKLFPSACHTHAAPTEPASHPYPPYPEYRIPNRTIFHPPFLEALENIYASQASGIYELSNILNAIPMNLIL